MSLSSPLGLTRHLRRPDTRLELVPWLNVLLVGLLVWMLGPRYLFFPGIAVGLSPGQDLPVLAGGSLPGLPADAVLTVLTAKQDQLFIYDGRVYTLDALAVRLRQHRPPKSGAPSVLLLKASQSVSTQTLMQIFALARADGFTTVQLAAEETSGTASEPIDAQ